MPAKSPVIPLSESTINLAYQLKLYAEEHLAELSSDTLQLIRQVNEHHSPRTRIRVPLAVWSAKPATLSAQIERFHRQFQQEATGQDWSGFSSAASPPASGAPTVRSNTTESIHPRRFSSRSPSDDATRNMPGLDEADIRRIVAETITSVLQNNPALAGPPGPPGQPGQPGPPGPVLGGNGGARNGFRPKDIGFFDPSPGSDDPSTDKRDRVYHNVFSFTNRLRVKAAAMDVAQLRAGLDACLLGRADKWYTEELEHLERVGLRADENGIEEWCRALENRFRDPPGKALSALEATRFTVQDVRRGRDPIDYIQDIVTNSRNAGLATSEYARVLCAYEHMDGELRRDLPTPSERSTVSELIRVVNKRRHVWSDIYGKSERPRPFTGQQSRFPTRVPFNAPYRPNGQPQGGPQPYGMPGSYPRYPPFNQSGQFNRPWNNQGTPSRLPQRIVSYLQPGHRSKSPQETTNGILLPSGRGDPRQDAGAIEAETHFRRGETITKPPGHTTGKWTKTSGSRKPTNTHGKETRTTIHN